MAITIPTALITAYQNGIDEIIRALGQDITLYFPPRMVPCTYCSTDTLGGKPTNRYSTGAPGYVGNMVCEHCGGRNLIEQEYTDTVHMNVYYNAKDWLAFGLKIDVPHNSILTRAYFGDMAKLRMANLIELPDGKQRYQLAGELLPHGLGPKRYCLGTWNRV